MPNDRFVSSLRILMLAAFLAASASTIKPVTATPRAASETYGRLPLHFEANRGQTHEDVRFLARGPGYSLYLTAGEAVLVLARPNPDAKRDAHSTPARLNTQAREAPVVVRMSLVGAAPKPRVSGLEELPGKANYFIGNDPAKWRTSVPTYAKVQYRDVYPGIDVVYYGNQRQLEYDFVVAPRADPQRIVLDFKGVERLEIDAHGELVMHAAGGAIRQHKPVIHQDIDGMRREIAGGYVMKSAHQVAFQVAAYDKTRPLVIDPVLSYSTYLGGSGGDEGWGITVDNLGNAYVTGSTSSTNFPTNLGSFQTASAGNVDAFVTKLNATGSALVYSTYLGGSGSEGGGFGIAVDSLGNAYVTGGTASTDFPVTPGAFQTALAGGSDAFVTKLDATGSALLYSTYLGGSGGEGGMFRIAVDSLGNAYVAGHTASTDFPVTVGAFQTAFVGNVAAFVTKLNATGSALFYSTYLGGSTIQIGGGDFKEGIAIAVDSLGNAYVAGGTTSNTFPTTPGAFQTTFVGGLADAFATKLNATGSALLYSTYLGGSGIDEGLGIALDTLGNAYVTGLTFSTSFPTTPGAFQTAFGGVEDAFVVKLADIGAPATLVLSPAAATNPVGTSHTVTATVTDAGGNPVRDIVVRFTVTGSVSTSGSCTTGANGQCSFTYPGPALPGPDVITAYADTDGDSTQDVGEPTGGATKIWALPVTTPLCEIKISNGGRITALNGDKASFGGNARSSATGQTSGQQTYQDQGPAEPLTVNALSVLAIVCEGTTQASIYGQATINGSGSFFYRIDVGEPGVGRDTYWILLQNGYNSGQHTLDGGNVQIRRTR